MKLTISHISKQYRRDFWGMRDFDLELAPGIIGLLGPNGAGKSTLMRMVTTITQPTEGTVYWNDTDIVKSPDTCQIVFSAPRLIANQLPAACISAFVVMAVLGSGALVKFIIAGDTFSVLGWLTAATFTLSLALAFGVLTGSSKAFEVIFVLWMYMFTQKAVPFDFIGMTPHDPLIIYAALALALIAVTFLARQWQLKSR